MGKIVLSHEIQQFSCRCLYIQYGKIDMKPLPACHNRWNFLNILVCNAFTLKFNHRNIAEKLNRKQKFWKVASIPSALQHPQYNCMCTAFLESSKKNFFWLPRLPFHWLHLRQGEEVNWISKGLFVRNSISCYSSSHIVNSEDELSMEQHTAIPSSLHPCLANITH